MKGLTILIILTIWGGLLFGQNYPISEISTNLLEGADAVVRRHEGSFKIKSKSKAVYKETKVITVLDKSALRKAVFVAFYNKLSKLDRISFKVYDKYGKSIHKAKSSDIKDESAIGDASLYADHRVQYYEPPSSLEPPFTVEYSYEKHYDYLFHIPDWYFEEEGGATEYSSFYFEYPLDVGGRYQEQHFDGKREVSESKKKKRISWILEQQAANFLEPFSENAEKQLAAIILAPAKFEYDGYEGDLSSWDGFASWIYSLSEYLEPLPTDFEEELKAMTAGKTDLEKAKLIYDYLQNNTRYVSIQLGIGGYRPFSPKSTHENGYGDCKALAYYTKSMLETVGLKAYYALVKAGTPPHKIDRNFASNSFNHVILYLPLEEDSLWLECTSQTAPFAYLGSFTSDREALIIKEDAKAEIRSTPSYNREENYMLTQASIQLESDGSANAGFVQKREALMMDQLSHLLDHKKALQEEKINSFFDWPDVKIRTFDLESKKDELELSMDLKLEHLLTKSAGNRVLLKPNLFSVNGFIPPKTKDRSSEIIIRRGYTKQDSIRIKLASNLKVELMFDPVEIVSSFGTYKAEIKELPKGDLLYIRSLSIQKGRFPANKYEEFYDFYKNVKRADKKIIALNKIP